MKGFLCDNPFNGWKTDPQVVCVENSENKKWWDLGQFHVHSHHYRKKVEKPENHIIKRKWRNLNTTEFPSSVVTNHFWQNVNRTAKECARHNACVPQSCIFSIGTLGEMFQTSPFACHELNKRNCHVLSKVMWHSFIILESVMHSIVDKVERT